MYVKSSIPSRLLQYGNNCNSIQAIPIEINLRKEKWLVISIYRPPKQNSEYFLNELTKMIDHFTVNYENYIIMGDFNLQPTVPVLEDFLSSNNITNLIKSNTCFKGSGSCIDLILTNRKYSFKHTSSYETGISDHHHMIYTMLKSCFKNAEPIVLNYRDYKTFSKENFDRELEESLANCGDSYTDFQNIFVSALNKHAPKKKKVLRGINKPHLNKTLRKEIMNRSRLKNRANKTKSPTDIKNYKKQRNYVVKLNKTAKFQYFNESDEKNQKSFWKNCKPFFTNKHSKADTNIVLKENGELLLENDKIADTFNSYFGNIVKNLNLHEWTDQSDHDQSDPIQNVCRIDNIIKKYKNHPSIKLIKRKYRNINSFSFRPVTVEEVKKVINDLKTNKSVGGDIPTSIFKESELSFTTFTQCINKSIETDSFPISLKEGDITPIHKKNDPLDKSNYRPVSVLPLLSKVYERLIYNQLSEHADTFLNNILCGFRKAHSTQHALFKLLSSWQSVLDNGGFIGTILMDLSKAYDCISHELLIAKLECYGLSKNSLTLLLDYLTNRKQRTKIGSSFSSWHNIDTGVPQGSILGPLLFNIFLNDLFFAITESEVCNFADDNTLYCGDQDLDQVLDNLSHDLQNVIEWFKLNSMKANPDKFQFMVLGKNKPEFVSINIDGNLIKSSSEVVLLGITIDSELKFRKHIDELCKRASFKLHALQRIRKYLTVEKARLIANAFIDSQFNYAPLIWMFAGKTAINKICKIHHRTLQVVYNDYSKTYDELLEISKTTSIHQRHLKCLAIEVFKSISHSNPEFMWKFFNEKQMPYNLRNGNKLVLPRAKSLRFGINSLCFRGSMLWNNLPLTVKNSDNINEFKQNLRNLGNIHCNCIVCH